MRNKKRLCVDFHHKISSESVEEDDLALLVSHPVVRVSIVWSGVVRAVY